MVQRSVLIRRNWQSISLHHCSRKIHPQLVLFLNSVIPSLEQLVAFLVSLLNNLPSPTFAALLQDITCIHILLFKSNSFVYSCDCLWHLNSYILSTLLKLFLNSQGSFFLNTAKKKFENWYTQVKHHHILGMIEAIHFQYTEIKIWLQFQ